eukprot:215469_1
MAELELAVAVSFEETGAGNYGMFHVSECGEPDCAGYYCYSNNTSGNIAAKNRIRHYGFMFKKYYSSQYYIILKNSKQPPENGWTPDQICRKHSSNDVPEILLYEKTDNKWQCVNGKEPLPKITWISDKHIPLLEKPQINEIKIPQTLPPFENLYQSFFGTFHNFLNQCMMTLISQPMDSSVFTVLTEYLFCRHYHIGIMRLNVRTKSGTYYANQQILLFCSICEKKWYFPSIQGNASGYIARLAPFPLQLLPFVKFKWKPENVGYYEGERFGNSTGWSISERTYNEYCPNEPFKTAYLLNDKCWIYKSPKQIDPEYFSYEKLDLLSISLNTNDIKYPELDPATADFFSLKKVNWD